MCHNTYTLFTHRKYYKLLYGMYVCINTTSIDTMFANKHFLFSSTYFQLSLSLRKMPKCFCQYNPKNIIVMFVCIHIMTDTNKLEYNTSYLPHHHPQHNHNHHHIYTSKIT